MKAGEEIVCEFCGKDSFLVKKAIMNEWRKDGDFLACSACGEKIGHLDAGSRASEGKKMALLSLLDAEEEKKLEFSASDDEKRFCRDCGNFISHPFLSRCALHKKNVEPMDDCIQFKRKMERENESTEG